MENKASRILFNFASMAKEYNFDTRIEAMEDDDKFIIAFQNTDYSFNFGEVKRAYSVSELSTLLIDIDEFIKHECLKARKYFHKR